MSIFSWYSNLFDDGLVTQVHEEFSNSSFDTGLINPANDLPMTDGVASLDVEGNPFGTDFSHVLLQDSFHDSITQLDDPFHSVSSFDVFL